MTPPDSGAICLNPWLHGHSAVNPCRCGNPPDSGEREPNLPCPHGRASWHHCPHCLGINAPISAATTPVLNDSVVVLSLPLARRILAALEKHGQWPNLAAELREYLPKEPK